jgi:hypothetical protein
MCFKGLSVSSYAVSRPTLTGQTSYGKKIKRTETPQVAVRPFVMTRSAKFQLR